VSHSQNLPTRDEGSVPHLRHNVDARKRLVDYVSQVFDFVVGPQNEQWERERPSFNREDLWPRLMLASLLAPLAWLLPAY
jgi:hypothetical protein